VAVCACCINLLNRSERPETVAEGADADTEPGFDPHHA
jgi:hypothetical protein